MLKDSRSGYGLFSILLHWVSALLIIVLFALGIYMVDLGYYDPWYHRAPALHISLGLVLLLLTFARIVWRIANTKPTPLPTYSRRTLMLSGAMKYALYLGLIIVIASGYLITTADGNGAGLFGLIEFPTVTRLGPVGVDRAGLIHELLAWGIVLLATLHATAALFHHFRIRDRTLVRMLKPVRKLPSEKD